MVERKRFPLSDAGSGWGRGADRVQLSGLSAVYFGLRKGCTLIPGISGVPGCIVPGQSQLCWHPLQTEATFWIPL